MTFKKLPFADSVKKPRVLAFEEMNIGQLLWSLIPQATMVSQKITKSTLLNGLSHVFSELQIVRDSVQ
jgi:hypothetical protein